MFKFPVVRISDNQKKDVRKEDLLERGLYRKCSTYRGGVGYDLFPRMCKKFSLPSYSEQFIVQLRGCVYDCPYCYVTREGVWGKGEEVTAEEMVRAYIRSEQETFHLMGGAPAIYIKHFREVIDELYKQKKDKEFIFHSDLMCTECQYTEEYLDSIADRRALYAVSIKGADKKSFEKNTRVEYKEDLL